MKDQLEQRLEQLHAELARGQEILARLDLQRRQTAVKVEQIRGAIQVLEEMLAGDEDAE